MKGLIIILLVLSHCCIAQKKKQSQGETSHFVCIQSGDVYHNRSNCASLAMCSGGKIRKTKSIDDLKPCPKCTGIRKQDRQAKTADFSDIKNVLGVKDKKQIADSLGTSQSTIERPAGFSLRISGPPDSRTVNMIEFFFIRPVVFQEDTLLSAEFYNRLGLQFDGCKADTIKNSTPHPVTGKVKKDFSIEYRGCARVEARDAYEDTSKYYYELVFLAAERDLSTVLEKIQLILRVERP